jgi:hypothetical protein
MTSEVRLLRDLVAVDADFKPSVQLPFDFDNPEINNRLVQSFIPTSQSIEILSEIARSLDPNSTERARTIVGTFGTGKSDLLLMICNYFAHNVDTPLMAKFYDRLREINPAQAGVIRGRREGRPPYLIVLLQADTVSSFPGFVLHGLQHALERAGLGHLMSKTRYSAAREQITTWQRDGHARYNDFCKTLQEHEERDVTSLLAALSGPQADDALQRFLRTFKSVTGADFNIYGYSQPHEAYATVAEALVATGSYSGILLVCDEFTAFMERFQSAINQQMREIDSETKAVENLAERSGSSGRAQVHFIVASLESFASAAGGIGSRSVAEATERIGGRFKQHSLLVQGSEELIRGAIKRLSAGQPHLGMPQSQHDDLQTTAESVWKSQGRDREWIRKVIVDGAFPLHPFTTYALPLINQKVAQSQRTMFLFLKDEAGLRGFIQREPAQDGRSGWLRLLTPDLLFDYFRESIGTKKSEVNDAYELAEQQLRNATVDTSLAHRVIKLIALCETVGSDLFLRPTRLFLRRALNLPPSAERELDHALQLLEDLNAVEPPPEIESGTGIYRLPMRGWVSVKSLRSRITDRAQRLAAPGVETLQANYPPDAISASDYNQKRNAHRKLNAYYVRPNSLLSNTKVKQDLEDTRNQDGLIWYVVTTTDAERAEAQSHARELTEQHPRLIVAVPTAPSNVLSALRDYRALVALRGEGDLEPVNKPYLEDHGKIGREYKQRLDEELKKLTDLRQWEWFAAGRGSAGLTRPQVDSLVNQLVEKVFYDTPNTNLQQHFKPDDLGSTIMKAVEQILKGEIKLDRSAKAPVDRVLRTGAVSLGLLQGDGTAGSFELYKLADPESSANLSSGKIARKFREHLAAGKPLHLLLRELRQPPFGLYDSILILFLAAFAARNADSLSIHQGSGAGRALDVDPGLLKKLLERPQEYTIRFVPLGEHERRWLRGLVERGLKQPDFAPPAGTTLRAAAATRVKAWISRQQLPAFAVKLSEEQLAETLGSDDAATVRAVKQLIEVYASDGDLAALLSDQLPTCLGASEQRASWSQTTVDELLVRWMAVCDSVGTLPRVLKERALKRAAALFDADAHSDPATRWNAIYRWRLNRGAVQADLLPSLPRELFRLTNAANGSVEQTLLDEFARRVLTVGVEYQRWQDLEKQERFFAELTKARDEIERAWKEVALGDDLWREGLARAASGRAMTGVSLEQVAAELFAWSNTVDWPACVATLTASQLQAIYPEVEPGVCRDLKQLLARASYDEQRWRQDLQEELAKAFGVQSFSRGEVTAAIRQLELALPLATSLSARLRRHVLEQAAHPFRESLSLPATAPIDELFAQWKERYTIPEPNDLSAEAKGLVFHVETGVADPESLLLTTLPRGVPAVGKPVAQWDSLDLLASYRAQLGKLITEIGRYEPVPPMLYAWLTGVFRAVRGRPLDNAPRECRRLTELVANEVNAWLRGQQMPRFVAELSVDELNAVAPEGSAQTLAITHRLLTQKPGEALHSLVTVALPRAAGLAHDRADWEEPAIDRAVERLGEACRLVEALPARIRARLLGEIGRVFTPQATLDNLTHVLREWRAEYVILPDDQLSSNARTLYDTLTALEDDAEGALLQRLPARITTVRAGYDSWERWDTKARYLDALGAAAQEISDRGKVEVRGQRAERLWHQFRQDLAALSPEERRQVVKLFRDEFKQ